MTAGKLQIKVYGGLIPRLNKIKFSQSLLLSSQSSLKSITWLLVRDHGPLLFVDDEYGKLVIKHMQNDALASSNLLDDLDQAFMRKRGF